VLDNQSQVDLIEASFEHIKLHKGEFSQAFYGRLFEDYPEFEPLFTHTDIERQGSKLYAALVLMVENLRHPAELERVLLPLGEKHIGYGATPEAFPKVGGTIIVTLQQFLGDNWTPELHQAWDETLQAVTATMLRGAGMTPVSTEAFAPSLNEKLHKPHQAAADDKTDKARIAEQVQASFARLRADDDAFTLAFYRELFQQNPQLQPLFEQVDMRKQGAKLHAALVLLVENLRRPDELEKVLLPLGKKHIGYGATAENYPQVANALLAALEHFLGDDWAGDVADAWAETLEQVQAIMLRGAVEQDAPAHAASSATVQTPFAKGKSDTAVADRASAHRRPSRRRGAMQSFANWFYSTSLSTIVLMWLLLGTGLIALSFVFPDIRSIVIFANPLSLLLALFLYIRETPERKKQFHYHAWSTIDHAAQVRTSNARFLALQDLCADGVSLKGLTLEGVELKAIDLNNADLAAAGLRECNLAGSEFANADLNNADLRKANLSGARLCDANLGFAKLAGANCSSADFSGANLMFADLSNANLSGAVLSGAKLSGAKLEGTYLSGADLRGTDIGVAELDGAFLVGARMPDGSVASA